MKLTNNEKGLFTDVIKLTYNDLISIGNGGTRKIATIPLGGAVAFCGVINTVDIVGSSTLAIDVGTTAGTPTEFISGLDVDAMTVGLPTYNTGTQFVQAAGNTTIAGGLLPVKPVSADTAVYVKVTDSAVASITAGEILIGIAILDLGRFA